MTFLLLALSAQAQPPPDLASLPQRVAVTCPEQGLCRIEVPAPFVAANPRSWLLLDEAGERVPYAVLREEDDEPRRMRARLRVTDDPEEVGVELPADLQVPAVEVRFPGGSFQAAVRAKTRSGAAWREGPWTRVGAGLVDELAAVVEVPDPQGDALRLEFSRAWDSLPSSAEVHLLTLDRGVLLPARVALLPGDAGPVDDGQTRYEFSLPGKALVRAVELEPEGDVFERPVEIATFEPMDGGLELVGQGRAILYRQAVGTVRVDRARLDNLRLAADRFVLTVDDGWDAPLSIPRASAVLARRVLLVRDGGRMTLYGGDPELVLSYDLQLLARTLSRQPSSGAELGPIEDNPAFADPLDVSALAPGAVVERGRFRFERAVSGRGVSRLELPLDVLAVTQSDLSDLRLVDAEGRQVPYVTDPGAIPSTVELGEQVQEPVGTRTLLRGYLPLDPMPVATLVLRSPDAGFRRAVEISSNAGGRRRLLSRFTWEGAPKGPSRRVVSLRTEVEGGLLVEIEHGDNRPIEILPLELTAPRRAILARLPDDGATLLYGDVARLQGEVRGPFRRSRARGWDEPMAPPVYDAARLAVSLRRAPAATATLGPVRDLAPEASESERLAVTAALAALVLGLLGLAGWLLRDLRSSGGPTDADRLR